VCVEKQGRHRYHRLASPAVAQMIESIMRVASGLEAMRPAPVTGPSRGHALSPSRRKGDGFLARSLVRSWRVENSVTGASGRKTSVARRPKAPPDRRQAQPSNWTIQPPRGIAVCRHDVHVPLGSSKHGLPNSSHVRTLPHWDVVSCARTLSRKLPCDCIGARDGALARHWVARSNDLVPFFRLVAAYFDT
jgi:hypothetical protein